MRIVTDYKNLNSVTSFYLPMDMITRKEALKKIAVGSTLPLFVPALAAKGESQISKKGKIKHSVCKWPYPNHSLEQMCEAAQEYGIASVELLDTDQWATVGRYGLTCAMANGSPLHITKGFNNPSFHPQLLDDYQSIIPKAAEAGLKNVICFSGNRNGLDDETGLENCAIGLEPVLEMAKAHDITICMELLNSKVDHIDYQCDRTHWGVTLCEKLGSDNFRLLYDIYHMQIMEGDIIATIRKYHPYIGHYHTGGVPGRNEIDETQELYYPAIMKAIVETGFQGYVAQEFIPASDKPLTSLRKAVEICDV